MATVKENITNALTWFYERLKSNDLDPMQEQIDELNTNIDVLDSAVSNIFASKSFTSGTSIDDMYNSNDYGGRYWVYSSNLIGTQPFSSGYYDLIVFGSLQVAFGWSTRGAYYRQHVNGSWNSWRSLSE